MLCPQNKSSSAWSNGLTETGNWIFVNFCTSRARVKLKETDFNFTIDLSHYDQIYDVHASVEMLSETIHMEYARTMRSYFLFHFSA